MEANSTIGTFIARRSNMPPCPVLHRAGPQLVADEQVAGDPLDLLAVHQVEAAPPALELQEARRLGVRVGEHVVVLVPEGVGRIEALEVLHQPGAVELAAGEVRGERGQPGAAQHAAGVAHRVVALALFPGAAPVGHRGAVDHDRAGVVRIGGGQHHRGPAALAVADDGRLGRLRVQPVHVRHELLLGVADVQQRLAGFRLGEEDDEVHGMARAQRDPHLRIVLEAADAGAMARAGIDHDVGAQLAIDLHALGRDDADQGVVDRLRQHAPVHFHLVVEMQHRGQPARARSTYSLPRSRSVSQKSTERWAKSTA
jgi:hypothetical protein